MDNVAAWARAIERHSPGVGVRSLGVTNAFGFPQDYSVDPEHFHSAAWGADHRDYVCATFTHVVIEAGRTIFGRTLGGDCGPEIPVMRELGLQVAVLTHGSDARIPSRHARREPYSPFRDVTDPLTAKLEVTAQRYHDLLAVYDGTVLVSTPDMLADLPRAAWCPVVIDPARWRGPILTGLPARPVVVHAPSKAALKGTGLIEPVLEALDAAGVITYRRLHGIPSEHMPAAYREADIVADQFSLGSYGVAACEAMATGRIVLGHVSDDVRHTVRSATARDLPVVEATPETMAEVIRDLVRDSTRVEQISRAGLDFVHQVHDGRMAVDALTPFLAKVGA